MAWLTKRRVVTLAVAVVVVVAGVALLAFLPVLRASDARTVATSTCDTSGTCETLATEFTVGDVRYASLAGTWNTSATFGGVIVTINDGGSATPCILCRGTLYTSSNSTPASGAFNVRGFGPFHVSVNEIGSGAAITSLSWTVQSAVL